MQRDAMADWGIGEDKNMTVNELRSGNYLKYFIGEEGLGWEITKIDWQDIKLCAQNSIKFNKAHKRRLGCNNRDSSSHLWNILFTKKKLRNDTKKTNRYRNNRNGYRIIICIYRNSIFRKYFFAYLKS